MSTGRQSAGTLLSSVLPTTGRVPCSPFCLSLSSLLEDAGPNRENCQPCGGHVAKGSNARPLLTLKDGSKPRQPGSSGCITPGPWTFVAPVSFQAVAGPIACKCQYVRWNDRKYHGEDRLQRQGNAMLRCWRVLVPAVAGGLS